MEKALITKIILSFVISGVWITFASFIAEKAGSKIGGLISNLPSNILISMIFVAQIHGTDYIPEVVKGVAPGMLIDTFFLVVLIFFLRYKAWLAILASLFTWFLLAYLLNVFQLKVNLATGVFFYFILALLCFIFVEKKFSISSKQQKPKSYRLWQYVLRALFAGSMVASIVFLSSFLSPFYLGIVSTFPAVLLSSLVILIVNQGNEFAMATGKVLIISSTNIVVYALIIAFVYPLVGIFWGTVIGFLGALGWVWMIVPLLKKIS